LGEVHIDIDLQ